ncbi:MAG: ATP-binding cassette domain-containing protein [Bacteroidales bacterium]|jgi:ABC-type multidrug transport system ATPase subunit|nr:ATP-binding cassette domain-containing protein [Bacteroidales bacterium]MDD4385062.1 ATP-binding cassette domain-containing protein [Bacteroidales bacterium]MDY0196291.1 ATP-binding cassette domain-containing protein [Tenuifilaceae bacterium]
MSELEVENLTKVFGEKQIFSSLSFSVDKGQKVAIKGESGRGKTTLLRILAGIVAPDMGEIRYGYTLFNAHTAKSIRSKMAYLPQGIEFIAKDGNELCEMLFVDKAKVSKSLDALLLNTSILEQPFSELSGGEKQRMLTSIILGLSRPILLLDEPTSALDANSTKRLIELIWTLPDITLISTSHNPIWEKHCDKVISL